MRFKPRALLAVVVATSASLTWLHSGSAQPAPVTVGDSTINGHAVKIIAWADAAGAPRTIHLLVDNQRITRVTYPVDGQDIADNEKGGAAWRGGGSAAGGGAAGGSSGSSRALGGGAAPTNHASNSCGCRIAGAGSRSRPGGSAMLSLLTLNQLRSVRRKPRARRKPRVANSEA